MTGLDQDEESFAILRWHARPRPGRVSVKSRHDPRRDGLELRRMGTAARAMTKSVRAASTTSTANPPNNVDREQIKMRVAKASQVDMADKDLPLREDIRLLGSILGDTIHSQEGDAMFNLVESIRQNSVRFHREEDETARLNLEAMLNSLSPRQTTRIIRAFSYFSHLANIAEDLHHIRRTRVHTLAGSPARLGTLPHALGRAREAGITPARLRAFFADALVSPVLTAHPTEVQRKSTQNREVEVAHLLMERERVRLTPEERAASDEALRRAVLILWQTNLLRRNKLTVLDEVENGLSYYSSTFLRELPRLYAALEETLAALDPGWSDDEVPSFLRIGSWIGGDRDGNPFVTAEVLWQALGMQSARALSFYLEEIHQLGGELSLSRQNVDVSETLQALADRSPDQSVHRQEEPYRRAISGIYARLVATARALHHPEVLRHPVGDAAPYADAAQLRAELDVLDHSLKEHGSAILAHGRLHGLRRAIGVFGFHLASLDLRQNSEVHERTVGELLEAACPGTDYTSLTEAARIAKLLEELATARPLASRFLAYSEETNSEMAILTRCSRSAPAVRSGSGDQLHHLHGQWRLGCSGSGIAAQGGGAAAAA